MSFLNSRSTKEITSDLAGFLISATAIFAAIYSMALTFVYVEGDDATSVVYHAMGRISALNPPYSAYHGMMDVFLGWLPASEPIVRFTAVSITATAALLMVVLILLLLREWLEPTSVWMSGLITLLLLACSPEIFYLGLVYTPSLVAMCFVLAAHVLVRRGMKGLRSPDASIISSAVVFGLSAVLFGIGVACRWDVGTYLFFIVADLALNVDAERGLKRTITITIAWA